MGSPWSICVGGLPPEQNLLDLSVICEKSPSWGLFSFGFWGTAGEQSRAARHQVCPSGHRLALLRRRLFGWQNQFDTT